MLKVRQKVHLVEANPQYALVEYPNGRQSNVSLRDLAPCLPSEAESSPPTVEPDVENPVRQEPTASPVPSSPTVEPSAPTNTDCSLPEHSNPQPVESRYENELSPERQPLPNLRRSSRSTRGSIPERLHEYVTHG